MKEYDKRIIQRAKELLEGMEKEEHELMMTEDELRNKYGK